MQRTQIKRDCRHFSYSSWTLRQQAICPSRCPPSPLVNLWEVRKSGILDALLWVFIGLTYFQTLRKSLMRCSLKKQMLDPDTAGLGHLLRGHFFSCPQWHLFDISLSVGFGFSWRNVTSSTVVWLHLVREWDSSPDEVFLPQKLSVCDFLPCQTDHFLRAHYVLQTSLYCYSIQLSACNVVAVYQEKGSVYFVVGEKNQVFEPSIPVFKVLVLLISFCVLGKVG